MPPESLPSAGINLAAYAYYANELPFVDLATQREWQGYADSVLGNGNITTDSDGQVTSIAEGSTARKRLFLGNNQKYPIGEYTLEFEGEGTIRLTSDFDTPPTLTGSTEFTRTYNVASTSAYGFDIEIQTTNELNPIKNVRLFSQEFGSEGYGRSGLLTDTSFSGVYRMMDWNNTNNSEREDWEDEPQITNASWSPQVPLEVQIRFANEAGRDLYINIPHLATDDYVENAANVVDSLLDPTLKVWVEYSNECWNSHFDQFAYCNNVLKPLYGTSTLWEAYGRRAGEVISIFKPLVPGRTYGVVAGQTSNPSILGYALTGSKYTGTQMADLAAIAPYFTLDMPGLYADYLANTVNTNDVFTELETYISGTLGPLILSNYNVARNYGIPLIAYEGGQHLVPTTQAQKDNVGFMALLKSLQREEGMQDCYDLLLDTWYDKGGKTFILYNDIFTPNVNGAWGLMEDYQDTEAPKLTAVQDYYDVFGDSIDIDAEEFSMDLIQYWPLNETSGTTITASTGNNGTYARDASNTTIAGPGTAFTLAQNFNGTTDYGDISAASLSFASGTALSVSGWIKKDGASGILIGQAAGAQGRVVIASDTTITVQFGNSVTWTVAALGTSGWHHILMTRNTSNLVRLFLDGVEQTNVTSGTTTKAETFAPNAIGRQNTNFCDGKLSNIKIYNTDESNNAATLFAEANLPVITSDGGGSTASVSIQENTTTVTTVVATGGTITYSITGGADAALFTINSSSGALAFLVAPDYENPAHVNNQCVVEVTATGPGGTDSQTITVTVTDDTADNSNQNSRSIRMGGFF